MPPHYYTSTEHARKVLARVDPGRLYAGRPVGLRDGAVIALLAGGLTIKEIAGLRADTISMQGGRVNIALERDGAFYAVLDPDLGCRVLAWLSERRLWGTPVPVFTGPRGQLTTQGIHHLLSHYRIREGPPLAHRRGRPPAPVNPLELLAWWEGKEGHRPLSQRALAEKLGVSQTTIRKHLQLLRVAGKLNEAARAAKLAAQGGHRRGGRPLTTINDTDLEAAWRATRSITSVVGTLHASRRRIRARLEELGLLPRKPPVHPGT